MTEQVTPAPAESEELDFDAWLDGAQRTVRTVTLYARNDLMAEIDQLEADLRVAMAMDKDNALERGLGESDPTAELQGKIDNLYRELDKSKRVFKISFLGPEEQDAIRETAFTEMREELDKVSAEARKLAQEQAKREGIKSPVELNEFVRATARKASSALLEREVSIRTIAAASVEPKMEPGQVRRLYDKLGDSQIKLLSQAYSKALHEAPRVTVPKSQKP